MCLAKSRICLLHSQQYLRLPQSNVASAVTSVHYCDTTNFLLASLCARQLLDRQAQISSCRLLGIITGSHSLTVVTVLLLLLLLPLLLLEQATIVPQKVHLLPTIPSFQPHTIDTVRLQSCVRSHTPIWSRGYSIHGDDDDAFLYDPSCSSELHLQQTSQCAMALLMSFTFIISTLVSPLCRPLAHTHSFDGHVYAYSNVLWLLLVLTDNDAALPFFVHLANLLVSIVACDTLHIKVFVTGACIMLKAG